MEDESTENCTNVDDLESFFTQFKPVHRYLSLIICVVGLVINTITLSILTRRSMRHGNNLFLLAIGICDFVILSTTPPRTIYFRVYAPALASVYWQYYRLYQASVAVTARTASLYLAAAMAVYRFHILRKKYNYNSLSHDVTVHKIIAAILTTVILSNIPNFTAFTIVNDNNENQSVYTIIPLNEDYISSLFWINGIVFKCIPCLILLLFGCGIVKLLKHAQHRQTSFSQQHRTTNKFNRTTRLLVCIILITLMCELPHALLSIIAGFGHCPALIYQFLGDVLDILALLNFTIAFMCQLAMNGEFRTILRNALGMPSSVRGTSVNLIGGEMKPRKYSLEYGPRKKETFRMVYKMTSFPMQVKSMSLQEIEIRSEFNKPRLHSTVQERDHLL